MLSYIVIGRNEEQHLHKCFRSIRAACEENCIEDYEIIYIDSNSSDRSVDIALCNNVHKICKLTKIWNAAIGRNVGAMKAEGDVLCFLDGDMEIVSSFLPLILDDKALLKYDLVSGDLLHHYYNDNGELVGEKREFEKIHSPYKKPITGGSFWIKKRVYDSVGGMDNRMRVSEDPELGLRLAKSGILLTYLPNLFVVHNTYLPKHVGVKDLKNRSWLYGSVLIYRFNLVNRYTYRRMIFYDSSLIVLFMSLIASFILSPKFITVYLLAVLSRVRFSFSVEKLNKLLYYCLRDVLSLIAFFIFYIEPVDTESIPFVSIVQDR